MPSLPKQRIIVRTEDEQFYDQRVSAGVTVDGVFTLGVPGDLADIAHSLRLDTLRGREWREKGVVIDRRHDGDRVQSKKMSDGIDFLKACAREFLQAEITTERLIVYKIDTFAAFWIDKNGKLFPNGDGKKGDWWKPKTKSRELGFGDSATEYRVGVGAEVWDRKSFKRSTDTTCTWERVDGEEGDPIAQLHSFNHITIDPDVTREVQTMPYTPEAALFFVKVILGICHLAKTIDEFFGDKKKLELAIKNQLALPLS